ncbi:anti-sigma factor [Frankia sp. AgB32]|uniref:anti-sigma factor family protein n=1 Tax=Frankia sp. AgB32 TaxID=631119 RepID=UPI00201057A7|nr:zf-HC2 domain-containing protein [Frankia sp. AgB32]MCK9896208.1 zf-HC2 domain-containing protein [Frankia sp. AgB32]
MTGDCAAPKIALGAYVLGALDPAERSELEIHLAGCAVCRAELASLAGLPGLLSRLRLSDVTDFDGTGLDGTGLDGTGLDGTGLDGTGLDSAGPDGAGRSDGAGPAGRSERTGAHRRPAVAAGGGAERALVAMRRSRRASRRRTALGAVALAAGVAAAAVGLTAAVGPGGGGVEPTPPGRMVTATDATSRVEAWVWMTADPAGTAFTLRLANVPPGSHCALVAQSVDGRRETAASWEANYHHGYQGVEVRGTAGIAPSDLSRLLVLTDDGRQLVALPGHPT